MNVDQNLLNPQSCDFGPLLYEHQHTILTSLGFENLSEDPVNQMPHTLVEKTHGHRVSQGEEFRSTAMRDIYP